MMPPRWQAIGTSQFPWEQEALEFLRQGLPDHDPYHAWCLFEFIADDGSINELDTLVLTPMGFFLVEIKSRPGELTGDNHTWTWKTDGRLRSEDNPLIATNRKAKKLASLLKRQRALQDVNFPFLEPLVFCSNAALQCTLNEAGRVGVFLRDKPAEAHREAKPGILAALINRTGLAHKQTSRIDRPTAKAICRALEQAGIRPTQRGRRIGDYLLGRLLYESPTGMFQDWEATHAQVRDTKRIARIYLTAPAASREEREIIQNAAEREFLLLQTLVHPGILLVESHTQHELGPALIFRGDPNSVRLDHFIAQRGNQLDVGMRLDMVRQIAEALHFAHGKKVIHCALSPQSILVSAPDSPQPRLQIYNWQLGRRMHGTSSQHQTRVTATLDADQIVEDASTVYLAPEALHAVGSPTESLDVFSLGALAYFIFTGRPPAESPLELVQKLAASRGLEVASVMDGAGKELQDLIRYSTQPEVTTRYDRASDFIEQLNFVEEELTRPTEQEIANPAEAKPGDRLPGGFKVKARLGAGSSAVALLVEIKNEDLVLKLARKPEFNDRVRGEFEVLRKLRHSSIVEAYDLVKICDHVGFLMQRAGEQTLSHRLRQEGKLHIDLLERFGVDLLELVHYLEREGTPHRDIKPDNLGIRRMGRNSELHLVLFDFSLSKASAENIRCGTQPYLDPFLQDRKPPRWDLQAERFAVAVTLYEMATGQMPQWGDGQSHPAVLQCEVTIRADSFEPSLREGMTDFFQQALRRDYRQRFDNAELMLAAWKELFHEADSTPGGTEHEDSTARAELVETATLNTQLILLSLSTRAVNALDRVNAVTVRDLLLIPLRRIYRLPGVGNKTRREVADLFERLRARFPDAEVQKPEDTMPRTVTDDGETEVASVDMIALQLLASGGRGQGQAEREILQAFLGFTTEKTSARMLWPSQTDVAKVFDVSRQRIGQAVTGGRERWVRNPSITALRGVIAELLKGEGGVMAIWELSRAILAARGSAKDDPERSLLAMAVTRAAVETESGLQSPRFVENRSGNRVTVAVSAAYADYAFRLGEVADELATQDPLVTPARVIETLRKIKPPADASPLLEARLVKLAAAASSKAALSGRLELYPQGMPAKRALELSQGALFGTKELTAEEVQQRVASRYPEAEALPGRPMLDELLREVGSKLVWTSEAGDGDGAYCYERSSLDTISSTTRLTRFTTQTGYIETPEVPSTVIEAEEFEERLRRAESTGAFLVLLVKPSGFARAHGELTRRFAVEPRDGDAVIIQTLKDEAAGVNARWDIVLQADAAAQDSQDWQRLQALVNRAVPQIEAKLSASIKTVLLTNPGLLARYNRLDVLERLRDAIGRTNSPLHGLWVLIPFDGQNALPTLARKAIPVTSAAQWARIPESWLRNEHRGAATLA